MLGKESIWIECSQPIDQLPHESKQAGFYHCYHGRSDPHQNKKRLGTSGVISAECPQALGWLCGCLSWKRVNQSFKKAKHLQTTQKAWLASHHSRSLGWITVCSLSFETKVEEATFQCFNTHHCFDLKVSILKRNIQQRRRQILQHLSDHGEVSVELLSQHFETSEVTIRKDLAALEANGLLLRRYGGAVPVPQEILTGSHDPKVSDRKHKIAQCAASLIGEHQRIIIDSGTTTIAMIPELSAKQGLVVMTNAIGVANALRELENEPTLLMTGGTWDPHSESFQGTVAEQVLRSYDFDQLFIGADGLDLERGTVTFNELIGLSRVMAEVAREVIVVAESDKIGRKIPNLELPWQNINVVVTDSGMSERDKNIIESKGVSVICATL